MRKTNVLSFLMGAAMTVSCLTAPILAEPVKEMVSLETEATAAPASSEPLEIEGETAGTPVASDPTDPIATMGDFEADGNFGLDAKKSLAGPEQMEVQAEAVLLYERKAGAMVYAKNIDERRDPASLTKMMTCLLALENGNLTEKVTVRQDILDEMDPSGSSSGLQADEVLTLEQLLYCLMVESANDAASVIADHIGGSEAGFVEMMNQKAQELGCTGTHFSNPHGLTDEQHYTTARDIGRILSAALENEKFEELYSTGRYIMPETNKQEERILITTNFMIDTTITTAYYDSTVVGGKTGFTTPAGRCVALTAREDGLEYICVVLGAPSSLPNGDSYYGSFAAASDVLEYGFDHFTYAEVLSPLDPVAQLPVLETTESVVVIPRETVRAILPVDYDETFLATHYTIDLTPDGTLVAPLGANQRVGSVQKYYGNVCIGTTDLMTVAGVERKPMTAAVDETVDEIQQSPWRYAIWPLSILLGILLVLLGLRTYFRWKYQRRQKAKKHPTGKRG